MKYNSSMGSSYSLHHYMAKSCLPSTCTYHLTYKLSPRPGFCRCFQYSEVDRQCFSYYNAYIIVYRYWYFGVINPANKFPGAGEALDL
jgi:hypothetical protein